MVGSMSLGTSLREIRDLCGVGCVGPSHDLPIGVGMHRWRCTSHLQLKREHGLLAWANCLVVIWESSVSEPTLSLCARKEGLFSFIMMTVLSSVTANYPYLQAQQTRWKEWREAIACKLENLLREAVGVPSQEALSTELDRALSNLSWWVSTSPWQGLRLRTLSYLPS